MNAPLSIDKLLPELDHRHLDWLEEDGHINPEALRLVARHRLQESDNG